MCRLFGEVSIGNDLTDAKEFAELNLLSKAGGPDATNFWRDKYCQLGFNRLAILDTSDKGNQPLMSPSGRYAIVFNGEVYNFQELIEKYKIKKSSLRSGSDTEVIAHLIDSMPVKSLATLLNGMFAIAIWDTQTQKLWLLRDFAGIKPFFYGTVLGRIVFASQFDQIYKHAWFKDRLSISMQGLGDYLHFGYMHAPNTIYHDIYQLQPGEGLTFDGRSGIIEKFIYKDFYGAGFSNDPVGETDPKAVNELHEVLRDVMKNHLIADVPLGSFLSGGIDSPIVTAIAGDLNPNVSSFTVGVRNSHLNEANIATQYASHRKIKNEVHYFTEQELIHMNDAHFEAYPEPFGDYSSLPTYFITREASKYFKVMLSGDGGDELFWGYPRFLNVISHRKWFNHSLPVRRIAARAVRLTGKRVSYAVDDRSSIGEWMLNQHAHNGLAEMQQLMGGNTITPELRRVYEYSGGNYDSLLHYLRRCEFYAHMQRVLVKVDRASMAHGLEVRVPFLDERVIRFSERVVPSLGVEHQSPKFLLKGLMGELFPLEMINQKKMGFSLPIKELMLGVLKEEMEDLLLGTPMIGEEFMDKKILNTYLGSFIKNGSQDSWGVWIFYALQKWSQIKG